MGFQVELDGVALIKGDTGPQGPQGPQGEPGSANLPVGLSMAYWGTAAPSGWLLEDGNTIGSADSGATARANADTEDLFTLLWTSTDNTTFPIQDASGAATTRGASAAADFAANKRMPLPDSRGRTDVGYGQGSGLTNRNTMGAKGGEEVHANTGDENGPHTHTVGFATTSGGSGAYIAPNAYSDAQSKTTSSSGSGLAHNTMPPYIVKNHIIKY